MHCISVGETVSTAFVLRAWLALAAARPPAQCDIGRIPEFETGMRGAETQHWLDNAAAPDAPPITAKTAQTGPNRAKRNP
jgi:hypothetical protein